MQLVDREIKNAIDSNILRITPFNKNQIKPNSYDVRLGEDFIYYDNPFNKVLLSKDQMDFLTIDPYSKESIEKNVERYCGETFVIKPYQFVLARTIESIELPPNMCAQLAGKSSVARLGLSIHQTAGFIDAGFKGTLTLELFNTNCFPIKLYAGMDIGQLIFIEGSSCCRPYNVKENSKYDGQFNPELSRYYMNDKPYQRSRNAGL